MTNGNDAAFSRPAMRDEKGESQHDDVLSHDREDGLSKREYFAAMAMQGIIAGYSATDWAHERAKEAAATGAVSVADALIEALNK